jgi:hypothetical protein
MTKHELWIVVVLALGIAHGITRADSPPGETVIDRSSPQFASTMRKLRAADYADRMNSTSWTADNPTLDHLYARKAESVEAVTKRLEAGGPVAPAQVARALDTSRARRLGGW